MKTRPFKLLENVLHHDSGLQCTHGRRRSKCTFDCVRRVCVMSWMGNREYHLTCKAKIWQREGVRLAIVFVAKLAAVAAAGRMTEGGFSCCRHPLLPRHHHPAYRQSTAVKMRTELVNTTNFDPSTTNLRFITGFEWSINNKQKITQLSNNHLTEGNTDNKQSTQ